MRIYDAVFRKLESIRAYAALKDTLPPKYRRVLKRLVGKLSIMADYGGYFLAGPSEERARLKALRAARRDIELFYDDNFAAGPWQDKAWAEDFCGLILKTFNPKSVVDFGCGSGDILAPFERRGVSVLGIDASLANARRSKIKESNFALFDLRDDYVTAKKYDLCLCLETAEHIEEKHSAVLIGSLTRSGDTVIFSAAAPGQIGVDHCNLKPRRWWAANFRKYGFEFDKPLTKRIKRGMEKIPGVTGWYIDNLMIFKRRKNELLKYIRNHEQLKNFLAAIRKFFRSIFIYPPKRRIVMRYLKSHQIRKLHIGCGGNILKGWLNADFNPVEKEAVFLDAGKKLPFSDRAFDYIFSEHLIEHLEYRDGAGLIRECFRVMKPGGKIRISTPDLRFLIELYNEDKTELQKRFIMRETDNSSADAWIYSDTFVINNFFRAWGHKFIYDYKTLRNVLEKCGFVDITRHEPKESGDVNLRGIECHGSSITEEFNELESMILEGTKLYETSGVYEVA